TRSSACGPRIHLCKEYWIHGSSKRLRNYLGARDASLSIKHSSEPRGEVVATVPTRDRLRPLHPLHAILLAFPLPLFLGALLSDVAYRATFEVQWINFA